MNRIFTCTNFRGYWNSAVASVIVAATVQEARKILIEKCKELKIPLEDENFYEFQEINLECKSATILADGGCF